MLINLSDLSVDWHGGLMCLPCPCSAAHCRDELHADHLDGELADMLVLLEAALRYKFADGFNPKIK